MGGSSTIGTFIVAVAMLAPAAAYSEQKYDPGVTDTEIKLGQTAPYSGPVSGYGTFGKASLAYFAMINEQGGINGRKIKLITVDDGFSPPKTVEQTRKLVESDGIFFDFASVGTAPNFAIKQYLNDNKIPQLFLQSGIPSWNDPAHFPWSMSGLPNYATEVRVFAKHILETKPDARIAILYQNDDFGREYLNGMRARLGSQADKMLVGAQSFELSDPTVDSQMITLRSSGADVLLIVATQKQTVQALRKTTSSIGTRSNSSPFPPCRSPEPTCRPASMPQRARSHHRYSSTPRTRPSRTIPTFAPISAGWRNTIRPATSSMD